MTQVNIIITLIVFGALATVLFVKKRGEKNRQTAINEVLKKLNDLTHKRDPNVWKTMSIRLFSEFSKEITEYCDKRDVYIEAIRTE